LPKPINKLITNEPGLNNNSNNNNNNILRQQRSLMHDDSISSDPSESQIKSGVGGSIGGGGSIGMSSGGLSDTNNNNNLKQNHINRPPRKQPVIPGTIEQNKNNKPLMLNHQQSSLTSSDENLNSNRQNTINTLKGHLRRPNHLAAIKSNSSYQSNDNANVDTTIGRQSSLDIGDDDDDEEEDEEDEEQYSASNNEDDIDEIDVDDNVTANKASSLLDIDDQTEIQIKRKISQSIDKDYLVQNLKKDELLAAKMNKFLSVLFLFSFCSF
jgi:hypothetical protein